METKDKMDLAIQSKISELATNKSETLHLASIPISSKSSESNIATGELLISDLIIVNDQRKDKIEAKVKEISPMICLPNSTNDPKDISLIGAFTKSSDILTQDINSALGSTASENVGKRLSDLTSLSSDISNVSDNTIISKSLTLTDALNSAKSQEMGASIESVEVDSIVHKTLNEDDSKMDNDNSEKFLDTKEETDKKLPTVSDQSLFMDEESCEPILRKPEPVSNIREETLAGDPRLESQDNGISGSSSLCFMASGSSLENKEPIEELEDTTSMSTKDKPEMDEDVEDEEETVMKKPKKRKKPRRSVYYRPRPDKKKKEKEKGNIKQHLNYEKYMYAYYHNYILIFHNHINYVSFY